jgi:hypothetical protein
MIASEENKISIFNEMMVSLYLMTSMTLAGYQSSSQGQYQCGIALVGIVLFTFAVNLIKFLVLAIIKGV